MLTTIEALIIQQNSPLLEHECALCHQLFDVGDRVVICPADETRHHSQCWESNGNHCVALACAGAGVIQSERLSRPWDELEREEEEQNNALIITHDEAANHEAAPESQWRTGELPGGGRYTVYQNKNKGCSWGCWLSCFLLGVFFCAILALGTATFYEAIRALLQSFLAG